MTNISRKFLAHRVFDLVKADLLGQYSELKIWTAIAETSDDALYKFYHKLTSHPEGVIQEIQKEINNA